MSKDTVDILKRIAMVVFNFGYEGYMVVFFKSERFNFSFDVKPVTLRSESAFEKRSTYNECWNAIQMTSYETFRIFNKDGEDVTENWRDACEVLRKEAVK